jgi:hypothetical protein
VAVSGVAGVSFGGIATGITGLSGLMIEGVGVAVGTGLAPAVADEIAASGGVRVAVPVGFAAAVGLPLAAGRPAVPVEFAVAVGLEDAPALPVAVAVGACARAVPLEAVSSRANSGASAVKTIAVARTVRPGRAVIVLVSCGLAVPLRRAKSANQVLGKPVRRIRFRPMLGSLVVNATS